MRAIKELNSIETEILPSRLAMKFHTYLQNLGSEGVKAELDGKALVDTGVALTVIDESLADHIGVKPVGAIIGVELRGICCEIQGELVSIECLEIEERAVGSTSVVRVKFSEELKEALRKNGNQR